MSHDHGPLIELLLGDLRKHAPASISQIVITLNTAELWTPPTQVAKIPVTVIRNASPRSFAANHNQAFAYCTTPVFAVLNPDLRLPNDPFPAALLALQDAHCSLAVPWQVDALGQTEDFCRKLITPLALLQRTTSRRRGAASMLTPATELDWVAGSFLALRSEAFRDAKGFDPRFRLYCEDADLCLRLQLAGGGITVLEDTTVVHAAQRASRRRALYLYWHLMSLARHWSSGAFWRYWCIRRSQ